ncbi:hypothetical protein H0H92_015145 [Tricholoma furcatifolium]|nr:hypothetical protein H0H92_015145 [Tricholoma furcatifolium]
MGAPAICPREAPRDVRSRGCVFSWGPQVPSRILDPLLPVCAQEFMRLETGLQVRMWMQHADLRGTGSGGTAMSTATLNIHNTSNSAEHQETELTPTQILIGSKISRPHTVPSSRRSTSGSGYATEGAERGVGGVASVEGGRAGA